MDEFLEKLESSAGDALDEMTRKVFARGLFANPRQAKRCLNIFRLLRSIAKTRQKRGDGGLDEGSIAWPLLAKTVVIQTQYPELYQLWRRYPTIVQTLETEYARLPTDELAIIHGVTGEALDEGSASNLPQEINPDVDADEEAGSRSVIRAESRSTPRTNAGGILAPFLAERQKYGLLEQMLTYPKDRILEGEGRTHFEGLDRGEMLAYVRLAGTASTEEPVELPEAPEDIIGQLLSGDSALIQEGVSLLESQAPEKDSLLRQSVRRRLEIEMSNSARPVEIRVSAGNSLSLLGDQRIGTGLNETGLPEFAWCCVPSGEFTMGTSDEEEEVAVSAQMSVGGPSEDQVCDWIQREKPQHSITLPDFSIAKYPVTNSQYEAFVVATDRKPPQHWEGNQAPAELRNHPVVHVSWDDAVAYCTWLTELSDEGQEFRLPSEAEWEKAARGTDKRLYPWIGDFDPAKCNADETGLSKTSPIGSFLAGASPYECLDMAGNVWEWCSTTYEPYQYRADDGREEMTARSRRVLRGGAFDGSRGSVHCAFRNSGGPDGMYDNVGFRVASLGC